MKATVAIRSFALSPEGELLRLSQVFVQWVHHRSKQVWVLSFAGQTMRLVECVVQVEEGKVIGIHSMGFSLIRFDVAGCPDMDRYWKEAYAGISSPLDLLDPNPGKLVQDGNVIHMEQAFVGNGGKWAPTLAERMLLEKAALGQIRPPELDRGWRRASRSGTRG